jgi:hypothetical protein
MGLPAARYNILARTPARAIPRIVSFRLSAKDNCLTG